MFSDDYFMKLALKEAQKAFHDDEVPIGAVIVCKEQIIARAYNYTERLKDATSHAEMQAFTSASAYIGSKYLDECILYVTLEPCVMCAGASSWTRIGKIVYGAADIKKGYSNLGSHILHPKTEIVCGVLEEECSEILKRYFKGKR